MPGLNTEVLSDRRIYTWL